MKLVYTLIAFLVFNQGLSQRFEGLPTSPEDTYGYTPENPLKLKKGQAARSTDHAISFLAALETEGGQSLTLIRTALVADPRYSEPIRKIDYGALTSTVQSPLHSAVPIDNVVTKGVLQEYVFQTADMQDTIHIFVDIYHKDDLQIPKGLRIKGGG